MLNRMRSQMTRISFIVKNLTCTVNEVTHNCQWITYQLTDTRRNLHRLENARDDLLTRTVKINKISKLQPCGIMHINAFFSSLFGGSGAYRFPQQKYLHDLVLCSFWMRGKCWKVRLNQILFRFLIVLF